MEQLLPAAAAGGVLALALLLVLAASVLKRRTGLPQGRVLRSDMEGGAPGKPLFSARYGLIGTPDYILLTPHGTVPVEVKPGRNEQQPRDSHMLQVLAYCLLLEDAEQRRPPYGLLRYSSDTFRVDYNDETKSYLLGVIEEMRAAASLPDVPRSHDVPAKCRACSYRPVCDESLWPET